MPVAVKFALERTVCIILREVPCKVISAVVCEIQRVIVCADMTVCVYHNVLCQAHVLSCATRCHVFFAAIHRVCKLVPLFLSVDDIRRFCAARFKTLDVTCVFFVADSRDLSVSLVCAHNNGLSVGCEIQVCPHACHFSVTVVCGVNDVCRVQIGCRRFFVTLLRVGIVFV